MRMDNFGLVTSSVAIAYLIFCRFEGKINLKASNPK